MTFFQLGKILRYLLHAFSILLFCWLHWKANLTTPPPWPDESVFLYPSLAFADSATFYAPELCSRPLFWMPPAYYVFLGTIFSVLPFSLSLARLTSLILIIAIYLLLTSISYILFNHNHNVILIALYFLDIRMIECANIARMEALLLFIVVLAFRLYLSGILIAPTILVFLSPLIHPNGFFFVIAFLCILIVNPVKKLKLSILSLFAVIIFIIIWLLYILSVSNNFDMFTHDFAIQLQRKADRNVIAYFNDKRLLVIPILLIVINLCNNRRMLLVILLFYIPGLLIKRIGVEVWYAPYEIVFWLFASFVVLNIARNITEFIIRKLSIINIVVYYLIIALIVLLQVRYNILNYHDTSELVRRNDAYIENEEILAINELIISNIDNPSKPVRVRFMPPGDGLLFRSETLQPVFPVCDCSATWDLTILHWSNLRTQVDYDNLISEYSDVPKDYRVVKYKTQNNDENSYSIWICY